MALVTTPLLLVMLSRLSYGSLLRKEILCMMAGLSTTMLKSDAAMKPAACNPTPSPAKAITSATSAPREKKNRKKDTLRSSPAKARAANTAQKVISTLSMSSTNLLSVLSAYRGPQWKEKNRVVRNPKDMVNVIAKTVAYSGAFAVHSPYSSSSTGWARNSPQATNPDIA